MITGLTGLVVLTLIKKIIASGAEFALGFSSPLTCP